MPHCAGRRAARKLRRMNTDPTTWLMIAAVFFLAGLVKGVIGLGLPTVAMGMLGLFLPPAQAAALLVLPSLLTNLWQAASGGGLLPLLRRLAPLLLGIALGTLLGTLAGMGLGGGDARLAKRALGGALVLYALFGLAERRLRLPSGMAGWTGGLGGLATGVITAATGVFVMPAVPYLQALGLERQRLLQAMGLSFSVSTLALALMLARGTALGGGAIGASALALAPTLLGMMAGQRLNLPPQLFRRLFFAGLLMLGLHLGWSA